MLGWPLLPLAGLQGDAQEGRQEGLVLHFNKADFEKRIIGRASARSARRARRVFRDHEERGRRRSALSSAPTGCERRRRACCGCTRPRGVEAPLAFVAERVLCSLGNATHRDWRGVEAASVPRELRPSSSSPRPRRPRRGRACEALAHARGARGRPPRRQPRGPWLAARRVAPRGRRRGYGVAIGAEAAAAPCTRFVRRAPSRRRSARRPGSSVGCRRRRAPTPASRTRRPRPSAARRRDGAGDRRAPVADVFSLGAARYEVFLPPWADGRARRGARARCCSTAAFAVAVALPHGDRELGSRARRRSARPGCRRCSRRWSCRCSERASAAVGAAAVALPQPCQLFHLRRHDAARARARSRAISRPAAATFIATLPPRMRGHARRAGGEGSSRCRAARADAVLPPILDACERTPTLSTFVAPCVIAAARRRVRRLRAGRDARAEAVLSGAGPGALPGGAVAARGARRRRVTWFARDAVCACRRRMGRLHVQRRRSRARSRRASPRGGGATWRTSPPRASCTTRRCARSATRRRSTRCSSCPACRRPRATPSPCADVQAVRARRRPRRARQRAARARRRSSAVRRDARGRRRRGRAADGRARVAAASTSGRRGAARHVPRSSCACSAATTRARSGSATRTRRRGSRATCCPCSCRCST